MALNGECTIICKSEISPQPMAMWTKPKCTERNKRRPCQQNILHYTVTLFESPIVFGKCTKDKWHGMVSQTDIYDEYTNKGKSLSGKLGA